MRGLHSSHPIYQHYDNNMISLRVLARAVLLSILGGSVRTSTS